MKKKYVFLGFIVFVLVACQPEPLKINFPKTDLAEVPIIPKPISVTPTHTAFGLHQNITVATNLQIDSLQELSTHLSQSLEAILGKDTLVQESPFKIHLDIIDTIAELDAAESYQLEIKEEDLHIRSKTVEGAFRGIQTLLQLIPEKGNDTLAPFKIWPIPSGTIQDAPQYNFRGTMLDVARHFFTVEEVKKHIDILSFYKFNVLHVHLTDDQGWRIEIKSWPKLAQVGGQTEVGGTPGGYYTQEDYKEIVAYAQEKHITIVPEIDMPGHTNAASLAYPLLDGTGKTIKPYTGMRVGFSSFNTRDEAVYAFIDDVVREIAALTPGPYLHIGGDESHATKKADYSYFVERVEGIVQSHGKRMMGWDEVATTNLSPSTVVQFWNNTENALKAAQNGNQILISLAKKMYLDMKYDTDSRFGLDWAGLIPVDSAYAWYPDKHVKGLAPKNILGIEAPLWSETISNSAELEYLAYPRVIGHAELAWSKPEHLNWDEYRKRLAKHARHLERLNVNFYRSPLVDWE
ncbi:MAG: family 20 glycosylhydrolase [Bacteroidota bacterium]